MGVLPGAGTFYFEGSDVGCLLIHGFTGTPQNIRPLGDLLARRGLTVLAPRLAGHGTSLDEFEQTGPDGWIATVATLDFDLERIGFEWLSFVRKHSRVLTPA